MPKSTAKSSSSKRSVTNVVDILREKLAANELQQGTKLREIEFAESLGVSRQVVRSAFTIL